MSDSDESVVLVDTPSTLTAGEPDLVAEEDVHNDDGDDDDAAVQAEKEMTRSATTAATAIYRTQSLATEDDANFIELTDVSVFHPKAYQIVSIGTEEDKYAFQFDQEKLNAILAKVPAHATVAVVSVVGAFRTGKSFLLSWFLRYLEHHQTTNTSTGMTDDDDDDIKNEQGQQPWYSKFHSLGHDGFDWKAGSDRYTTGIWMWSDPYMIADDKAVLLIDTQGMFDHETTMALTASIFGFSTLLSSYQIYNVDKRIQEDNLQQLALFSEYARMAVGVDEAREKREAPLEDQETEDDKVGDQKPKPFQQIEFLVRDWQHFDEAEDGENYEAMEKCMETYLESVIAERDAKDLKETREQILSCFETISCYGLCHPGTAVTKKKYTGDVDAMDKTFLQLLVRYCDRVFHPDNLQAKVIHGRVLTADQLGVYVKAYADLFASGATFPTAGTMLEATAMANNTNAVHMAVAAYKENMNRVAGPHCENYIRVEDLQAEHAKCKQESIAKFASIANFGSERSIEVARDELLGEITSSLEIYESLNESRNPLAGVEM